MPKRRLFVDITPLRASRDYRLLYAGQAISVFGRQLTVVASAYQVFQLTHSSFAVGLLSLAQLGPLLVCSLVGGGLADALDRRKLLMATQLLLAATSAGLALNAQLAHPTVWAVLVFTSASAGLSAIDAPTRAAAIPTLVSRDQIPAAAALNQTQHQLGQVVGPAAAGIVIGNVGLAAAYWLDVATFGVALGTLLLMAAMVPDGGGTRLSLGSIHEGLRYLAGQRAVQGTFLIDVNAMLFGMPRALFPQLGLELFGGGSSTVGLLYAAPGVGAMVGALTTGWVGRVRRQGAAVVVAVVAWGAAIALFGVVSWLPLALVLLALAGAADVVSAVFRGTILQLQVPDRLRGRLSALKIAVVTGGPRLGDLEAGAVAAVSSARFSVISGGLACVVGALALARVLPEMVRWTAPEHERV